MIIRDFIKEKCIDTEIERMVLTGVRTEEEIRAWYEVQPDEILLKMFDEYYGYNTLLDMDFEIGFSSEFINAMMVGYYFYTEGYEDDERTDEWKGSEECSLFTKLILEKAFDEGCDIDYAFSEYVEETIEEVNSVEGNLECHMWDDICKGFLAGEIIGYPTEEHLRKVKQAEKLWDDPEYGYYQEVLEEVMETED